MSTAIDDIEALATELEAGAVEHRQQADECDRRADALRAAASTLTRAKGEAESPFTVSIGHTDPEQVARDSAEYLRQNGRGVKA